MSAAIVVIAKAPVAGLVKTRIGCDLGDETAAALAASALLDTMDAVESLAPTQRRVLALDGDLRKAVDGDAIAARLSSWQVCAQPPGELGVRIAAAFAWALKRWGSRPTALIGMDTPQLSRRDLDALLKPCSVRPRRSARAALGPADDGGWWGLGLSDPSDGRALSGVPMSTSQTCVCTQGALTAAGVTVSLVHRLRDMDSVEDAIALARVAPATRVAGAVRRLPAGVG